MPPLLLVADLEGETLWEISKNEDERKRTEGELYKKHTCKELGKDSGLESSAIGSWADDNSSPLAMTFNQEKGWVTGPLGPTSGHWKHLARKVKTLSPNKVDCTSKTKCKGPVPLQELDPNNLSLKRRKGKLQVCEVTDENVNTIGGEVVAAVQHHRAWNCRGLGTPLAIRTLTEEVKKQNPVVVFLAETKANTDRMKGFQQKLGLTQGIIVPSDGQSGGLAMLWREGTDIWFKSCSHSHIDVIVHGEGKGDSWRISGFMGT